MKLKDISYGFVDVLSLVDSGTHRGHRARLLKSAMQSHVLGSWCGINILNVSKTLSALKAGFGVVFEAICANNNALFLCNGVRCPYSAAEALGDTSQPCVISEFGGVVTNWATFRGVADRVKRYNSIVDAIRDKRLIAFYKRRIKHAYRVFVGAPAFKSLPGAVVLFCGSNVNRAIHESNTAKVPVIGLVDSFSEAAGIDYVAPVCEGSNRIDKLMCGLFASVCSGAVAVSDRARLFGIIMSSIHIPLWNFNASQALAALCVHFKTAYVTFDRLKTVSVGLRAANVINVRFTLSRLLSLVLAANISLDTPLRRVINLCKYRLLVAKLTTTARVRLFSFVAWLECLYCLVLAKAKSVPSAITAAYGEYRKRNINVNHYIPRPAGIWDSHIQYHRIRYSDFNVVGTLDYFFNLSKRSG
ncbi:30S ribosomal protein S2 [Candidatus Hodgkinia cicadicola]